MFLFFFLAHFSRKIACQQKKHTYNPEKQHQENKTENINNEEIITQENNKEEKSKENEKKDKKDGKKKRKDST